MLTIWLRQATSGPSLSFRYLKQAPRLRQGGYNPVREGGDFPIRAAVTISPRRSISKLSQRFC
jgi:hypothetical protein